MDDLAEIRAFYSVVGYGGDPGADDRILVTRRDGSIVAAVRLSPEQGVLVLRGMYVLEELRGTGIGTGLLERTSEEIGASACWCIPYTRLENFYSQIGFRVEEGAGTPDFLAIRKKAYIAAGHEVSIMHRPAEWAPEPA